VLEADRARTRAELLADTEKDLAKIRKSVAAGRLKDPDKIGIRVGKVIGKRKVAKHFITDIGPGRFSWRRDEEKITAEATFDGIYVIRTSVSHDTLDAAGAVTAYKDLKHVERDFRIAKADDLDLRPIHHYLADRVRCHVLICMLACYLTWHLRAALAELTFTDQDIPVPADPVMPAQRSHAAQAKDATKRNSDKLPVRSYQDLLTHLSTLSRQVISFSGQKINKLTTPTPVQRRAFELLGAPVPITLQ
jgi:transposase